MKLASVKHSSGVLLAVEIGEGQLLIPSLAPGIWRALRLLPTSVRDLLSLPNGLDQLSVALAEVRAASNGIEALKENGAILSVDEVELTAPVPNPLHFMGVGASYQQHLQEMGGVPTPLNPVIFLCSSASLAGHRQHITVPSQQPDMLDYEGELAIIIGKACYNVSVEDALEYVAGYTSHNDISPRDHVKEVQAVAAPIGMLDAWGRNVAAKQHPTLSPMGPYLVTIDEIPDPHALTLETRVNGEVVQSIGTNDLIFSVAQYVAYVSSWYSLKPGDIISTGTPGGVGIAKKPPQFLKPGDIVDVEISGIGTLSNMIGVN